MKVSCAANHNVKQVALLASTAEAVTAPSLCLCELCTGQLSLSLQVLQALTTPMASALAVTSALCSHREFSPPPQHLHEFSAAQYTDAPTALCNSVSG